MESLNLKNGEYMSLDTSAVNIENENDKSLLEQNRRLDSELRAEREKLRIVEMQVAALKISHPIQNNAQPAISVDVARGRLGLDAWKALTDAGRLQAIGVDPNTVTDATKAEVMELFGPKSDSAKAHDAFKSNAGRYRHLKNIGICAGWI
ncbi:MAG TPA: hypothetical protein VHZ52_07385 [Acidobacteriaceae bacterium]|jgi:hypothetical protein|nr:hypothetical protein [Acidobacteriaceae bacterium]